MPAAAVIPAPRAYINVVAVKKPVVGFEGIACGGCLWFYWSVQLPHRGGVLLSCGNGNLVIGSRPGGDSGVTTLHMVRPQSSL